MPATHDAFVSYSHAADGALAPVLERGLERLAKPTFKLRAIDVFRDQTSLSASPGVWSGIVDHLAGSRWFIVLASPQSAASAWCQKELRWWLDTHGTERLLVVLTEGAIAWDDAAGDFDWAATTALPQGVAAGRFAEVPLYVDLRWVRDVGTLDARDPRLRAAWLDLAAPVRGVAKDQLDGDDVRQLRRTRWLARAGVALITLAAAVAAWQAVEATNQRRQAEAQRELAVSRQLAAQASALRVREPVMALLLAAQSHAVAPTGEALSALIELARAMPFERLLEHELALSSVIARPARLGEGTPGTGGTVWAGDADGQVWRLPLPAGAWTRIAEGRGGLLAGPSAMAVAPDGRTLAVASYGGNTRLLADGASPRSISSPVEKEQITLGLDFSADQRLLAMAGQALDRRSGAGFVVLHDLTTGAHRFVPGSSEAARVRFSPDGRWLAIGGDRGELALHALRPGDKPPALQATRAGTVADFAFADGGRRLFVAWSFGRIDILDTSTGQSLDTVLSIDNGFVEGMAVAPDGSVVVTSHGDGSVRRWSRSRIGGEWESREIYRHPSAPRGLALLDAGNRMVSVDSDGRLVVARDLHLTAPQRLHWQSSVDLQQAWLEAAQGRIGVVTAQGPRWVDPASRRVEVAAAGTAPPAAMGSLFETVARQGAWAVKRQGKAVVLAGPGGTRPLPVGAPVDAATFSADGQLVYTLAQQNVRAWKTDTLAPAGPDSTVGERGGRLVASPDGRWLAVVHAAPLQIGKLARGVRRASVSILSLPDLQPRVQQAELDTDENDFAGPDAMFSPDSRLVMLVGKTQLYLFDTGTLRRVDANLPLGDGVQVLGFLQGRWPLWLADTGADRLLTLDLQADSLADWACTLAGRGLTGAEWTRYLGDGRPYAPRCKARP